MAVQLSFGGIWKSVKYTETIKKGDQIEIKIHDLAYKHLEGIYEVTSNMTSYYDGKTCWFKNSKGDLVNYNGNMHSINGLLYDFTILKR